MSKRRGSEDEDHEPKRMAVENRDTSPLSVQSGFDARERRDDFQDDQNREDHGEENNEAHHNEEQNEEQNEGHEGDRNQDHVEDRAPENVHGDSSAAPAVPSADETYLHLRILVSDKEAGELIGRGGENLGRVRDATGVRYNVSESYRGAVERIVNIKGPAEHVAKAAGLLVRVLHEEPFDQASSPDAKRYNLRILMPHHIMGALIGKGGSKFREIEEASAARIKAQDKPMPFSNDRCLSVYGVADAIHIAVYYLAITYTTHKEILKPHRHNPYDPKAVQQTTARSYVPVGRYGGRREEDDLFSRIDRFPDNRGYDRSYGGMDAHPPLGGQEHQDLYVPNDYVGSVIGRGGQKITEIRRVSNCHIKVTDTKNLQNERLIQLSGTLESIRHATYLIQARVESERKRAGEENCL